MSDNHNLRRPISRSAKALEHEAAALKQVTDQQIRIRNAARAAFQEDRDPMRVFAETFSYSIVAHVEAIILLQKAFAEETRAPDQRHASPNLPLPSLPFPSVLEIFGVVPLDPIRFRAGAIMTAVIVLLGVFGVGVIVGKC